MADYKYDMILDFSRVKQSYRNKYLITMNPSDRDDISKYNKYQIIDILQIQSEDILVFQLKSKDNKIFKMAFNYDILKTGKAEYITNGKKIYCRIVNARNFPTINASYLNL